MQVQVQWWISTCSVTCATPYLEIVKLLIENGADVNAQGGGYGNALYAASWYGHLEILMLLGEGGRC